MAEAKNIVKVEKEKQLSITKTYNLSKPAEVLVMAKTLKAYVVKEKLFAPIKGKNYAMVEGWMFAGFLTGIEAIVEEPKNLSTGTEVKWSCTAKLYDKEGKVVGMGFALCSNKEAIKKGFDEYAIMSMAQTRAIGKAYRNKMGWVMKLAGYEGTPSEEMHKVDQTPKEVVIDYSEANNEPQELKKGQVKGPDGKPTWICEKCKDPISPQEKEFSVKIYNKALCREHQAEAKSKK